MHVDFMQTLEAIDALIGNVPLDLTCKICVKSGFFWVEVEKVDGETLFLPVESIGQLEATLNSLDESTTSSDHQAA